MTTDQRVADQEDELSVEPGSILRLMLALRSPPHEPGFEQAGSLLWDLASGAPEAAFMLQVTRRTAVSIAAPLVPQQHPLSLVFHPPARPAERYTGDLGGATARAA